MHPVLVLLMEVSAALQAGGATPAGAMPKPPAVLAARVQALAQAEARADAAAAQDDAARAEAQHIAAGRAPQPYLAPLQRPPPTAAPLPAAHGQQQLPPAAWAEPRTPQSLLSQHAGVRGLEQGLGDHASPFFSALRPAR
jgi:hypothetical protein